MPIISSSPISYFSTILTPIVLCTFLLCCESDISMQDKQHLYARQATSLCKTSNITMQDKQHHYARQATSLCKTSNITMQDKQHNITMQDKQHHYARQATSLLCKKSNIIMQDKQHNISMQDKQLHQLQLSHHQTIWQPCLTAILKSCIIFYSSQQRLQHHQPHHNCASQLQYIVD